MKASLVGPPPFGAGLKPSTVSSTAPGLARSCASCELRIRIQVKYSDAQAAKLCAPLVPHPGLPLPEPGKGGGGVGAAKKYAFLQENVKKQSKNSLKKPAGGVGW